MISAETLKLHHGKHHKKYIDTTNQLLASADVRGTIEGAQLRVVTPADAFAVTLKVPGEHNARNALAACAAAHALEIPPRAMQAGLAGFAGVPGRLQRLHCASGSLVIDDDGAVLAVAQREYRFSVPRARS